MKQVSRIVAVGTIVFSLAIFSPNVSNAAMLSDSGGSTEETGSSNIALTMGNAIERVASTISQIVSPQPADSPAVQKAYQPVPQAVCHIVVTYVVSYVPYTSWTYQGGRLIPIITGTYTSLPIQSTLCD